MKLYSYSNKLQSSATIHPFIHSHGFSILSQFHSYFPHAKALLMNRETLEEFRHLWGREGDNKRCTAELTHLLEPERQLYLDLKNILLGNNVRLEQERIAFGYLCQRLQGETSGQG